MNVDFTVQSFIGKALNVSKPGLCSYRIYYALIAKPKGEASNRDALSFRVGIYVYPQLVQCNSMLVYVYPQHLYNTILCSHMYIHHACATIAQFSGQNVSLGRLWPRTTV